MKNQSEKEFQKLIPTARSGFRHFSGRACDSIDVKRSGGGGLHQLGGALITRGDRYGDFEIRP